MPYLLQQPRNGINERAREQERRERYREKEPWKQPLYTIPSKSATSLVWLLMILFADELMPSESVPGAANLREIIYS